MPSTIKSKSGPIIVTGASAGGLKAFVSLIRQLRKPCGRHCECLKKEEISLQQSQRTEKGAGSRSSAERARLSQVHIDRIRVILLSDDKETNEDQPN